MFDFRGQESLGSALHALCGDVPRTCALELGSARCPRCCAWHDCVRPTPRATRGLDAIGGGAILMPKRYLVASYICATTDSACSVVLAPRSFSARAQY